MLKDLWYNIVKGEASPKQVTEFYGKFNNIYELATHLINNQYGILKHPEFFKNITTANIIYSKYGTYEGYENLIKEFAMFRRCVDEITEYKTSDGLTTTLIKYRDRYYKLLGFLLNEYANTDEFILSIEKRGIHIIEVNKIFQNTKSFKCECC